MNQRPSDLRSGWPAAAKVAAALVIPALACFSAIYFASLAPAAVNYIQDDVKIAGAEIYTFEDANQRITVVVGNFHLAVGRRQLSGRDAVIWIKTNSAAGVTRHDMTVYSEGNVQIVDSGGATTSDQMMLVEVHAQGRILAKGKMIDRPLRELPLYARAQQEREKTEQAVRTRGTTTQPFRHEAPELVIASRPPHEPNTTTQATRPRITPEGLPVPEKEVQPVSFYADSFTSEVSGKQRVMIAKGNVYLAQGDPRSDMFLELRGEAAVVFTERRAPKEGGGPLGRSVGGFNSDLGDANEGKETIVGVYLVQDVAISRGERSLRGPEAYYDFTIDRAIIREPVFRTRQEERNIPIYIRAKEGRLLSAREMWFKDAEISTSDFYTPSYSVNADAVYIMDKSRYDDDGMRVSPQDLQAKLTDITPRIENVPLFWWPVSESEVTQSPTALRKATFGKDGTFGYGGDTQWYLFRLLGLVAPEGFRGTIDLGGWEHGGQVGVNMKYSRQNFSGYDMVYDVYDARAKDKFGRQREYFDAPDERGRLLARHKQDIDDWEVQLELSYISDRNYLEQYFPEEYWGGKEQETLIYVKKQQDNWAFTSLLKYRLNRFQTDTDSLPEFGFHLIGEPILNDSLLLFSDSTAGVKHFRPANDSTEEGSDVMARADSRNEIDFPLHLGPLNLVQYATGRGTVWSDAPQGGDNARPYGQVGVKSSTDIWRQYDDIQNRTWDVNGLRHIITPQATGFMSGTGGVEPNDLYPMDPDVEQHLMQMSGWSVGLYQRLQTRRGEPGQQHTADWMRLNVVAGFFSDRDANVLPADGRFLSYRPEDSLPRNNINAEYAWNISDATTFSADTNYDTDEQSFRRINYGITVQRDPRLAYYLGVRQIKDMNSKVLTVGTTYDLTRTYRLSVFEQYDLAYDDGTNLVSSVALTRKVERWYVSVTFTYNAIRDETSAFLSFWPEGVPEVNINTGSMRMLGRSSAN